jgi:hypothetical protein
MAQPSSTSFKQEDGAMENGTWSEGSQRGLSKYPGGNADCGQHAAGDVAGSYMVGSIQHTAGHGVADQVPGIRTPFDFEPTHGLIGQQFRQRAIPNHAHAVAYLDVATRAFHYARIEAGGVLSQTDANQAAQRGMGGTFMRFAPVGGQPSMDNQVSQRGVQPVQMMQNLGAFVDYCAQHYSLQTGLFFFCRFA